MRQPLRTALVPSLMACAYGMYAASLYAGDPDEDHMVGDGPGGYDTGACDGATFPLVMAFRPSSGWTGGAGDGEVIHLDASATTVDPLNSFRCVEYVHDLDPTFINQVEHHYDGTGGHPDVTTIWHGAWATISMTQVDAVGLCDSGASDGCIYAGHLLTEVGTILTQTPSGTRIRVNDHAPFDFPFDRYVLFHRFDEDVQGDTAESGCDATISGWEVTHDWLDNPQIALVTAADQDSNGSYIEIDAALDTSSTWVVDGTAGIWVAPIALTWNEPGAIENLAINIAHGSPAWSDTGTTPATEVNGWVFYTRWVVNQEYNGRLNTPDSADPSMNVVRPNGIEFDGARWRADHGNLSKDPIDVDNNLCLDRGYVDGYPVYGLGGMEFSQLLRAELGNGVILQADASIPSVGYRGYQFFNGIEIENFEEAIKPISFDNADASRPQGSSASLSLLTQWVDRAIDALSYPLTKEATAFYGCDPDTGPTEYDVDRHFRVGAAAAWQLGMPHAYVAEEHSSGNKCFNLYEWPEYRGGLEHMDWDWLGSASSDLIRDTDDLGPNLITSVSWSARHRPCQLSGDTNSSSSWDYTVYDASKDAYESTVGACTRLGYFPDARDARLRADINNTSATNGETLYTVYFRAIAENTWPSGASYSDVVDELPRLVRVRLFTIDQGDSSTTDLNQDVLVDADGTTESTYYLSFLVPDDHVIDRVEFTSGEQPGTLWIGDLSLHEGGADRFLRRFDGGAVLLNLTDAEWEVEVDSGGSGWQYLDHDDTAEPPPYHGGWGGTNGRTFIVSPWDGLIVTR